MSQNTAGRTKRNVIIALVIGLSAAVIAAAVIVKGRSR